MALHSESCNTPQDKAEIPNCPCTADVMDYGVLAKPRGQHGKVPLKPHACPLTYAGVPPLTYEGSPPLAHTGLPRGFSKGGDRGTNTSSFRVPAEKRLRTQVAKAGSPVRSRRQRRPVREDVGPAARRCALRALRPPCREAVPCRPGRGAGTAASAPPGRATPQPRAFCPALAPQQGWCRVRGRPNGGGIRSRAVVRRKKKGNAPNSGHGVWGGWGVGRHALWRPVFAVGHWASDIGHPLPGRQVLGVV